MQYLTKTQLTKRWSRDLVEGYFPFPSEMRDNPRHPRGAPMQLYDINQIKKIERRKTFKAEFDKVALKKVSAAKAVATKYDELISHIKNMEINLPNYDRDRLTELACKSYNKLHRPIQRDWEDWVDFQERLHDWTPASKEYSDESFLKRITINYLRHKCTIYEKELRRHYGKVGRMDAHDVLQTRINEAIKQKYEWLR